MSVRSHETQFEQSYERKTKNGVGVFMVGMYFWPPLYVLISIAGLN